MRLSLIIPTLNRPKSLADCLRSIAMCETKPDEVIIIDQSDDPDVVKSNIELCREFEYANYVVSECKSSAGARNIGISRSTGDVLVFSDDDVTFKSNFFNLVTKYFSDEKLGLLGAYNSLERQPRKRSLLFACIFDFHECFHKTPGYITKSMLGVLPPQKAETVETTWAMGYCFCVRRSIANLYAVRFDENMKGYAFNEDLDFTMRFCALAKKDGYQCEYRNDVFVEHHVSQEYRSPSIVYYMAWLGNRIYMLKKNGKGKNRFYVWLTYFGLLNNLRLRGNKTAASCLKKAYKIVVKAMDEIQAGHLDYVKILEAQQK